MSSAASESSLPVLVVQLYLKYICAQPECEATCAELLSRLPVPVDRYTQSRAREAVKRLLINGRLTAAEELFKRADPESADDLYLISLSRYLSAGGLNPEAVTNFWKIADVTGPRLSLLRRQVTNDVRRLSFKPAPIYDHLREILLRKDVDGAFKFIKESSANAGLVYNYLAPQLLRLGVSPQDIVDRLEPAKLKPAAAFGCIITSLAPYRDSTGQPRVNYEAVEALLEQFDQKGYFPMNDFVQLSNTTIRRLVAANQSTAESSTENWMLKSLDIIGQMVQSNQLKSVVNQLFEYCLFPFTNSLKVGGQQPTGQQRNTLLTLIDACVLKDIKFPPNHWIFYTLENCGFPQDKVDQLKLPSLTNKVAGDDTSKPLSVWRRLYGWLSVGDVESTVDAIKNAQNRLDNINSPSRSQSLQNTRFPDAVAIAYGLIQEAQETGKSQETINYPITAQDVERLFWASWDGQLLTNPLRAISQVAHAYNKMGDIEGLSKFFGRASKQLGAMQDALLSPVFMTALLHANFSHNLKMLQSMISSPYLSTANFANSTCMLEDILATKYPDRLKELTEFQRNSSEYWPVKVLSNRFRGISHLQRLRTIHNAVDELCKSNSLFAAHSLRIWASHLGLLILPKTNELLIVTPYVTPTLERQSSLPRWCMSHELSQHFPVNLDSRALSSLDSLLFDGTVETTSASSIATWLVDHVLSAKDQPDTNASNWLPTWLVICQRLHQTGSQFTDPAAYFALASGFIKQGMAANSNALAELNHWFLYAPTMQHKASIVFAALGNPISQTWAIEQVRSNPHVLHTIGVKFDSSTMLTSEQHKLFSTAVSKLGRQSTMKIADCLRQSSLDLNALKDSCAKLTTNEIVNEFASFVPITERHFEAIAKFLQATYPDSLVPFFDKLLLDLGHFSRRLRLARLCREIMQDMSVGISALSLENQAFLYAAHQVLNSPHDLIEPLELFSARLPTDLRDSWPNNARSAIAAEDFFKLYELVYKLDPSLRSSALSFVAYSLPGLGDVTRLKKLMNTIAEHVDGQMLLHVSTTARPFLLNGLGDAYRAIARFYNNEKIDWFDRACIRYHKLGPLLQRKGASSTSTEGTSKVGQDTVDELTDLIRQPISSVVHTILKVQSEPEKLTATLTQILSGWSPQRKAVLLSYLTAEGAADAIERIVQMESNKVSKPHAPYVEFAKIIGAKNNEDASDSITELVNSALQTLSTLPPREVNSCLRGPHLESLFRSWPSERLGDFLTVVSKASEHERTSLHLQLAAIMINRGRQDLVEQLIKNVGALPTTFLSGSPRHILSKSELEATLTYLTKNDPDHVSVFVDTCLRNAVSTANPVQTDDAISLVRTITSPPYSFKLQDICLLPTVNLMSDFLRRTPKLPSDVLDLLKSVVDHSNHIQRRQRNL